jgi:hypothetical protein
LEIREVISSDLGTLCAWHCIYKPPSFHPSSSSFPSSHIPKRSLFYQKSMTISQWLDFPKPAGHNDMCLPRLPPFFSLHQKNHLVADGCRSSLSPRQKNVNIPSYISVLLRSLVCFEAIYIWGYVVCPLFAPTSDRHLQYAALVSVENGWTWRCIALLFSLLASKSITSLPHVPVLLGSLAVNMIHGYGG